METAEKVTHDPHSNGALINAIEGLSALSKIGSKDDDTLKRLSKMIIWVKYGLQAFEVHRDSLVSTWAQRDESDEIVIKQADGSNRQTPVMKNEAEFNLAMNALTRQKADVPNEAQPEPFKWVDLKRFQKMPDAMTISALGPFVVID